MNGPENNCLDFLIRGAQNNIIYEANHRDWFGNVRELIKMIERAVKSSGGIT
jgi:transcriptional regulator with AAA-type ATPase domain